MLLLCGFDVDCFIWTFIFGRNLEKKGDRGSRIVLSSPTTFGRGVGGGRSHLLISKPSARVVV